MPHHNVFGLALEPCCMDPLTGFYRDGLCRTDEHDGGRHVVCAIMTAEFLAFTAARGNDLSTPRPAFHLPRPEARRPLVPVRAALEGGPRSWRGAARGAHILR